MENNIKNKRWERSEDKLLMQTVRAHPQNLHRCFVLISEEIGRTPGAVANHWYTKVSKQPEALCFFTASPKHISKNRKNGLGVSTTESIWRRFMRILNAFVKE